ncbi:YDG domain-containing protein [Janthinobacterium sp. PSPC2-1]|uniref:YDG domain-containing protein n=1 Tax=unclassified Janthinobacterium TaxID=2610881 RepID=UPI003CF6CA56
MNRIYRLVWSHVHQTWVAVHERARGKGKSANRRLIASVLLAASHSAMAGPTGGQVTAGNGTINQNGATTTVTQASQNLSLNWQSFNTSSGETVNFVQPSASAIAVNRIGGNSATQFYGALNANGQVYLINPNGVLFGAGSQINVGGLVASTLDTGDAGLGGATRRFTGSGTGSIINQGAINTGNGGYVAFIGNQVSNSGTINARAGTVALGAGSDVTLSFSGDSLVQLQVNQGTLNNLAENGGLINADGGAVWLSAGARNTLLASVVNNTGIIQARSVQNVNGVIVLEAGSAGAAGNSGTLDASGLGHGETGGAVKVLGGAVTLAAGSLTDVSGNAGGGTALIGGNFLDAGAEQNAHTTTVAAGASIKADAMTAGNGGSVAVWSDGATQFNGSITARGGSAAGNGGQVETSGKSLNINASAAVNTASPHGVAGDWLLDPDDITIGNNSVFNNGLNGVSYPINVDTRVLSAALNNGNVTIKTTGSSASCTGTPTCTGVSGNGDIIVLDLIGSTADYNNGNLGVLWESGDKTLTLSAYRDIYFKTTSNVKYGAPGNPSMDTFEGGVFSYGSGNVVLRADNTATGTGTVRFEGQHLNSLYLNDIRSTISIYYNPSSYNTPTPYANYMASDASQLTAYMAINVGGTAASKIYDGSNTASVSGLTPAVALPSGLSLNTASAQATFANKNVGANKAVNITGVFAMGTNAATTINSDGATVISYNSNNYFISGLDSKTATITAKTVNLNGLTANSKTYDGTTSATLSGSASVAAGIVNGDSVTLGTGSATFADANAGIGKAVTVTGYALTGVDAGNYVITLPTGLTANINKADLTLAGTKTYDGTTSVAGSTLTATGVAGQTFSVTGAGDASNLSSKNVQSGAALASATGLSLGSSSNGGLASNYNAIGMAGSSYTVTAKGITLTGISAVDKIYDATTTAALNAASVGYSGLISGDVVSLAGSGTGSFATKNVGVNKAVTVSGYTLSGLDAGNYVVTQPTGLTASISKANLAVSGIAAANKTYNATTGATLSGAATVTALGSDIVSVAGTGTGSFADANAGSNKAVSVTGYTLNGADAGNYNLVQPAGVTATINKADVIVSGSKTYDGATSVAGSTLTATGVAGQTFSVTGAGNASNLSSKNVQSGAALASTTGLSLGSSSNGGLASNYNAPGVAGSSYTVTAKGITLTGISAVDKIYDATTTAALNAASVGYSGLISGDVVSLAGSGTGSFATKNVGVNKAVTVSGYTLSGADAGNYVVTQPTGLTASISKANLAVSGIAAANKTYNATTGATLSGAASVTALGSDIVSVAGTGTGSFADANAGSNKAVSVTGYTLNGADAGNYNLVQPAGVTATINKADVIVSGSKTYDGATSVAGSTLTATGVAGQTFTVTGAGDAANLASKNVQVGTVLSSLTGLSLGTSSNGGLSSNYNALSTAGSSYMVTAKGITLTGISAVDKIYDANTTAALNTASVGYSGLISGDSVSLAGSGTGSFATKNVGVNKTVTVSGYTLSGADAGNYVVTQPSGLTASISKANLVVSGIAAANKTYDATTGATLSGAASVTALGGDSVSVAGTGTGSFADANAASNKAVSVTGYTLNGADAGNYNLVQPAGVTANINKADLTLAGSKTYDGTTSVAGGTLTATGVAGQTFTVTGAGDAANLASKNVQVGTVLSSLTGLSLGTSSNGGLSSNYNALSTAGSSYMVTAKGITLTGISAVDKTYDANTTAALNTASVGYSGLISGDSVSLAGSGTGNFLTKDVGVNKPVTVSGYTLSGADAGNYVVTQPTGLTASISKASLVVSGIAAANKTYDATTGATLSGTAAVSALGRDSVSVIGSGAGSFDDANAASNKAVSVTGYTLTGADAGNYDVVQPNAVRATINKADVIVSGSKTYDGTTSVAGSTLTATGVAGQTFSVTGAGDASNLSSKNVQSGAALASTTGLSLDSSSNGGLASNYNAPGVAGSSYTVTAKGITLTGISAVDKTYDANTTAALNTASVGYSGLINGDTVSLAGSGTGSFADKNVGANKAVTVSGYTLSGADAGNYVVTQPTGLTASISKASLVVSGIAAANKTYDATTGATLSGTAAVSALGRDSVSVIGSGAGSFDDANAGSNKAVSVTGYTLTGADAGNYDVVQPNAVRATINKADVIVSGSKTYDGTTSVAGSTLTATGVAGQTFSVTGAGDASNLSSKNVQSGAALASTTGLSLDSSSNGGLASNYNAPGVAGSSYTVTAKGITLTGISAVDKTYDANTDAALSGTAAVAALGSDSVSVVGVGTGRFADKNAGANKAVTVSGYTLAGLDAGNYVVTQPSGLTATINKASLAVSGIAAVDKTYDATTGAALSGTAAVAALGSDSVTVAGIGAASFADKNAGANKAVTVNGYTLAGADAGNYVVEQPSGLTATINKASLAVSGIAAVDKTYDATTGAALSGTAAVAALGSDSVSVAGVGVGRFADKNAGANKAVSVSGYTLAGADAGNYVVTQPSGLTATINKASLAVSGIAAVDKTYDATTGAALSGTAAVAALGRDSVTVAGIGAGTFADKNAGANKAVTVSGYTLSGADAGNYVVEQPSGLTATINKASLAVSGIAAVDKTYDATTGAALSGTAAVAALGSDSVTVAGTGAASFADKNAGANKAVTVSGYTLSGADAGNYVVTQPSGLTATINKASLAVSGIAAVDKTYDATTGAALSGTAAVAALGRDSVTVAGTGAGSFADKNAGANKAVSVSGYTLSGADAGNYVVTQPSGLTATINKASLAVSGIAAVDKTYDATTGATLSGTAAVAALGSDSVTVAGIGAASFADKNAGANKAVTVSGYTLAGLDAGNYVVTQPSGLTATINKASLAVSGIAAVDKTYDATTGAALSGTAAVAALGRDSVTVAGIGAGSFADKNAGANKAVTVSGYTLAGADAGNYVVEQPSGLTATINKASLAVSGIAAVDKTYDATTGAALSGTAVVAALGSDSVSVIGTGTGSFADKNAGANKAVSVSGYTLSGADAGNYVVTQPSGLTATINKASLAVSGIAAIDKTYDATTGAALSGTAAVAALGSDSVSVTGAGVASFADKNAGANKAVSVSGYTLAGADAGNYVVTQPSGLTASIARAALTVSGITAADKVFDGSTAATVSTANATLAGKFASDDITLASTGQFSDAAAGVGKTVNLSSTYGGADIGNYLVTGQAQAIASIAGGPVVVPDTPAQQVQSAVAQVQSSLLPPQALAQPQLLSLSTTLVVQQLTDSGSSSNSNSNSDSKESSKETLGLPLINTATGFGTPAPMLKIQNGGMQLPLVATSSKE